MFLVLLLKWLLLVFEVVVALPLLYLCMLSISATLMTRKQTINTTSSSSSASPRTRFAILIPAHNEEVLLGTLLKSLAALDYPKDLYRVYVIADNCTDSTAELARATEWVRVYERFDDVKRGKGYAINWILQQLEKDQLVHDAYVIFDADSVVEPNFLQAMDKELAQGAQALQGRYTVLNATESPSTILRWIALTLISHVRSLGRKGIGGSAALGGNGMCFSRDLLKRYPWQAFSVTEDYQYYLQLVEKGERVRYVPEAIVHALMPTTFAQMRSQDIRWETPDPEQGTWRMAWRLLKVGLRSHDFMRIEAAVELLTPQLSFLVTACFLALAGSLALHAVPQLVLSWVLTGVLVYYISTALYLARPPRAVYIALLYAPGFIIWKLWVLLVLRRTRRAKEWVRTSRPTSIN